jgi:16S rRNA (cytidine1402-2'-O)-methyltransferase
VTVVVAGATPTAAVASDPDSLRAAVSDLEQRGTSRKEAIVEVARLAGIPKREVYQVVHTT